MRLVQFEVKGEGASAAGLMEEGRIHELKHGVFGPYRTTGRVLEPDQVVFRAPVHPGKIIALGLNYRDHAEEMKFDLPAEPMLFLKAPSSVIGPGQSIVHPVQSHRMDYEAELAVVIGRRAKAVPRSQALQYVLGYTCLNDVTARDLQAKDGQWARAKSFDTFCPLGPAIETDLNPSDLAVEAWLNGQRKQASRTSRLVFDVPALIEYISAVMTLCPGDVIATGTPAGVGPLKPGDVIEIRIEGIGGLINSVEGD
jgi:2-keto-4-pentenoate hydratase/2-oxohepta-3-ene-1,7-dioic acid hydratase in catechol pathway